MNLKQFTVVKYTGKDKKGLTSGKQYGAETDSDLVDNSIYGDFGAVTVWDDEGFLREIELGKFEILSANQKDWFKILPKHRYVEIL